MNYTQNYHLPQWEKADRVLMDDFNQMCLDMEAGLIALDGRVDQERDAAGTHLSGLDKGLFRLAYNHYCSLKELDSLPEQLGLFWENATGSAVWGTQTREDGQYISLAEGTMNSADFFNSFSTVSEMKLQQVQQGECTPQILSFSCPLPGRIDLLYATLDYSYSSTGKQPFLLSLKNLDTNTVEWTKQVEFDGNGSSLYTSILLQPAIPFHANCRYHLIMETLKVGSVGKVSLDPKISGNWAVFYGKNPTLRHSHILQDFEGSQGGLLILRCRQGGTGADVTLTWNGTALQPARIRNVTDNGCEPIQEWIYVRNEPLPATNEISLNAQCRMDGEFWFYDWGAILL